MDKRKSRSPILDRFSSLIGRTRFIVLFAVVAVLLVSISLFLLGTIQAVTGVWNAWKTMAGGGDLSSTDLTVEFLEIVSTMLKAVIFYIIGVGFYSLFVAPLNITVSLGMESLSDLESKVISVVVVILGLTFLEHFILWKEPLATLQFGLAAALMIGALVLFERHTHLAKEEQKERQPQEQAHAQEEMFVQDHEKAEVNGHPEQDGKRTPDNKAELSPPGKDKPDKA